MAVPGYGSQQYKSYHKDLSEELWGRQISDAVPIRMCGGREVHVVLAGKAVLIGLGGGKKVFSCVNGQGWGWGRGCGRHHTTSLGLGYVWKDMQEWWLRV